MERSRLNIDETLNPLQREAVRRVEGPLLIIAGAGSGKTRVITYRVAYMLERGIPQSEILALTFTNKAAAEMETRVKELTGRPLKNLTVKTFHAFGVQILRADIEALGYRPNFSIYDEGDRAQAVKEALRETKTASEGVDLYALGALFSRLKTEGERFSPAELPWRPAFLEYRHSLKVYNALDFDDLIALPVRLFLDVPGALEKYRRRYRYIMVDEFQDTSALQYRLMRLLAKGPEGGEPSSANVCVVGDDDQSIYSWRGANYGNILNFEKDFPGAREIKLEQNYRSTGTILEAANGVISNNTNRKDKRLWSALGGGKPVKLFYPGNEAAEADFIAAQITDLAAREGRRYSDFGILVRTNSLMQRIEEALLEQNIPYAVSGGTSFFAFKEIKDVLSYLRLIGNTDDDTQLLRIINTPRRGIGKAFVEKAGALAKARGCPLWDALAAMRYEEDALFEMAAGDGLDSFMTLIETQREEMPGRRGLSKKVRALVDTIDYWSYLVAEHGKNEKLARWKFTNIQKLIDSIAAWEQNPDNPDPTLYPYLNRVSLLSRGESAAEDAARGKASLMTIHAAKGLEFPVVFIAGAEDGLLPHVRSVGEDEGGGEDDGEDGAARGAALTREAAALALEEERRLFYVAITRARDALYITSCRRRRRSLQDLERLPSPFIAEIPPHLLEEHSAESEEQLSPAAYFSRLEAGA